MRSESNHHQTSACPGCAERDRRVARLEERIAQLERRLEAAQRAGKRQAAPFAKGSPKAKSKKPGRKPGSGHGEHFHRAAPERIDEVHTAALPRRCAHCGGAVQASHIDCQYQVEIPRAAIYRRFDVAIGHCEGCGKRVAGRHRLQTCDALGAAASQLGPHAQAAVAVLNKRAGLSHGKIATLLQDLFGITLSRSGACRAMQRTARRCGRAHQRLEAAMAHQGCLSADETGWRIGGQRAWLHTLTSEMLSCYRIARSRGGEVAAAVLGWNYDGVLIHDGWAPYDKFTRARHQTCLAHLLRRCRELLETATGGAVIFPRQVKALLKDALAVRDRRADGVIGNHGLRVARGKLAKRLDRLLRWRRVHVGNARLAKHLYRHRDQLFTFLETEGAVATNWRAEQAIRPAVVNRKVWGGNRTDAGACAQAVLMSVLTTIAQQDRNPIDWLSQTLRGQSPTLV